MERDFPPVEVSLAEENKDALPAPPIEFIVKISLWLDSTPERFLLSEQLSRVLGIREETRARIVAAIWQYIKQNRLQDSDDRGFINLNSELQGVFGGEEKIKFHQIMGLLKPHLLETPPLEMSILVKRGAPRSRQFMSFPVMVYSGTFKKALQFLVDHDHSLDCPAEDSDDENSLQFGQNEACES